MNGAYLPSITYHKQKQKVDQYQNDFGCGQKISSTIQSVEQRKETEGFWFRSQKNCSQQSEQNQ